MQGRVPELSLAHNLPVGASAREVFSTPLMCGSQRYAFIILRDHSILMHRWS
jgi:hypothetical protein